MAAEPGTPDPGVRDDGAPDDPSRDRGRLQEGDRAPDFELPDQSGTPVRSEDLRGAPLVVFFYPKDESAGCTREACTFRDVYHEFVDAGARVVGISNDPVESHRNFANHHELPYPLLSDETGAVARAYGVGKMFGLIPQRVTFVLDANGVVVRRYESMTRFEQHAQEALRALGLGGSA